ncbi:hypothetical protein P8452_07701 [Trifolium repens]|nr:hypothetical protein P8452_07701 [Trifolium repens]
MSLKSHWYAPIVAAEADQLEGGQNIVKALSCFENKLVPPEATDFFCSGPCLIETQLLLECIDNMLSNFIFYNKANTGISAKAQRKAAREIKTAQAFGLMPFTTMGKKSFIYGRTMENLNDDFSYRSEMRNMPSELDMEGDNP